MTALDELELKAVSAPPRREVFAIDNGDWSKELVEHDKPGSSEYLSERPENAVGDCVKIVELIIYREIYIDRSSHHQLIDKLQGIAAFENEPLGQFIVRE